MDHIVSYKEGSPVYEMDYYKSNAKKVSDLRRWRDKRKHGQINDIIIFFEDGTIFDTFLRVHNKSFPAKNKFWRHYYRLKKQPGLCVETILAVYKKQFEGWATIVKGKNGINSL